MDKFSNKLLRGPSPFTPAQRELFAAFVSGLNACDYCHGTHQAVAANFGIAPQVIEQIIEDETTAEIEAKLKPVLSYLRKLTVTPSRLVMDDAQKVFDAGWSEQALYDAICICCLFSFYNRLLDGHGIKGNPDLYALGGEHLHKNGYGVPWFMGMFNNVFQKSKLKKLKKMSLK